MQNIDHLPKEEKQHFILCECGEYIDMRNLAEVFGHLHMNAKTPEAEWTYAIKKGEPAAYPRTGTRIDLN
ncbi:MAG: hypothetical protein ACJ75F_01685 [Flavisolibacter sp.]|jgi:hypothetical protein